MGNHRAPRAPRRLLVIGGTSLAGATVAAVLGLTYSSAITPEASASIPPPPLAEGTSSRSPAPADPLSEPWVTEIQETLAKAAETPVEPLPPPPPSETPTPSTTPPESAEDIVLREAAAAESAVNDPLTETEADHEHHLNPAPADWSGAFSPSSTAWTSWAEYVRPQVFELANLYSIGTVYTRPGHSPDQQHAADFMTTDQATGDALAAYALQMPGVEYVIWQQRYNDGSGWSPMEDRGTPTANHMDHVHVSFY